MLLEKLEKQKDFTNVEKQIKNYIMNNLNQLSTLSARKLGEVSYTSKASVIRFCQKMGFNGYEDFKKTLEIEVKEQAKLNLLLSKEPVNKDTSLEEVLTIIPNMYTQAIGRFNLNLNKQVLKRVISKIRLAPCVDIYGVGITFTCAETAKFKFETLGIYCNTFSSINEHYIRSTRKQRNKFAIVLSFTGANQAMIEAAKYLKQSGTFVVGIGGSDSKELKKICDEYIEFGSTQYILSMEVMTPFLMITYTFDVLFTALLVADFENNVNHALDVIDFRENVLNKN